MTSPTQRSLKYLRERGFTVAITEHWNHYTQRRMDLFGFGDLLAVGNGCIILVQTTSGANTAARITKIKTECRDAAIAWLNAGGQFEVHGWRELVKRNKDGTKAVRGKWEVKLSCVTLADFAEVVK